MKYNIECRQRIEINTDPQRRCYNGCHAKSEMMWGPWKILVYDIPKEKVEELLKWWRKLNDYAVGERGESAKREFRAVEIKEE